MSRSRGSSNKEKLPPALQLNEEERVQLLANLIIDILVEEDTASPEKEELCKAD